MTLFSHANTRASSEKVNQNRLSISLVPALLFIAALISPLVSRVGHSLILAWISYPVWLILIIIENPKILIRIKEEVSRRSFALTMFACWTLVIAANFLYGRGYTGRLQLMIMVTLGMVIFMEITYTVKGGNAWKTLVNITFILLGAEVIWSLPTLWSQPMLARNIMWLEGDSPLYTQAALAGVGEYGFYTGCAIVFPFLVAWSYERKGLMRLLFLVLCGAIAIAIILANFTGATFLMVAGFCLLSIVAFLSGRKKMHLLFYISLLGLVALGIWRLFLYESVQAEFLIDRVTREIIGVREKGLIGGDTTNRAIYWEMSLNTFLRNPLVGIGPSSGQENPFIGKLIGVHSSWLDTPAEYGLIGFTFYVAFLLGSMRRVFVAFKTGSRGLLSMARLVSCFLFILCGTYNPVTLIYVINVFLLLLVMGGLPTPASHLVPKKVSQLA